MTAPPDAGARLATRLASRAAHDLNNVAAVFSGHIYLLRNGGESQEEGFEAMEKAMEHLDRLTRSLTALGALGLEALAPADVNDVIHRALANGTAAGVVLDLDPSLPPVSTRPGDLVRVIEALVKNAREASPTGSPVRVATRRSPPDSIEIGIEDSGGGVPDEVRRRGFDPLHSTKGAKGRGIGVTLASTFAFFHAGSLTIESRPEGGTRATLRLPAPQNQL